MISDDHQTIALGAGCPSYIENAVHEIKLLRAVHIAVVDIDHAIAIEE
jgi:hypothetical protein